MRRRTRLAEGACQGTLCLGRAAPLLHAARQLALEPAQCWYVGDDLRDVQAAHAAGMRAVAVEYGYLGTGSAPRDWNAHAVIAHPMDLIARL